MSQNSNITQMKYSGSLWFLKKICLCSFLRGNWDYCLYKSDAIPDFTELDWKTKQDFLWSKIIEDESLGEYHTLDALKTSMKTPFENEWDILTAGRRKVKNKSCR